MSTEKVGRKMIVWRWKKNVFDYAKHPNVVGIHLLNSKRSDYRLPHGRDGFVGFEEIVYDYKP